MLKNTPITFIYSSPSVEPFKNLVNEILDLCGINESRVDDIFNYGVFCSTGTYTHFVWKDEDYEFDIPEILTDICADYPDRDFFVNSVIEKIMSGEITKPDWMVYVEEETSCNNFNDTPSTFLRVSSRYSSYTRLGELIVKFLYSPNMMTTLLNIPS